MFAVCGITTYNDWVGIKYKVNQDFFKSWSATMAYVLGYLYADGSLEDASYLRGKYIRVSSVEKSIIIRIRRWLDSRHSIVKYPPSTLNGRPRYLLKIGSHALYNNLVQLGLYPNKSLTVTLPSIPGKFLRDFVRGYFDGDGCVYFWRTRGKTRKIISRKLSVIFTSGSKKFLEGLAVALNQRLGLKQTKIYDSHRSYQLRYVTEDSIKIFKFLYRLTPPLLFLRRKYKKFFEFFSFNTARVDNSVRNILQSLDVATW